MNAAFFSVGFRPFYLGAAGFAFVAIPLWIYQFATGSAATSGVAPMFWHAHEMVFGFAPAVIIGFLLTAVRNWTGRQTPAGAALAGLFALWLAARLANWLDTGNMAVVLDAGFLLAATIALSIPILAAGNRRNYFVVALLLGLTAASTLHGLALRGAFQSVSATQATRFALDLILLLMVIIGGRVIPAFSANAIAGLTPRRWTAIEIAAIGTPIALLAADAFAPGTQAPWWDALCFAAAAIHLIRLAGWQPWKTRTDPLLLVLPLAYLWIPVHLILRATDPALAMHALTVGAMSSLMLAMITRSALGHTGRPLRARPQELVCFGAIHLAALSRVAGPLLLGSAYVQWLWLAAAFWTIGFGVFMLAYWPILTRPRISL